MAQTYQVDIVTKVSGYSSVQKLEKAIAGLAGEQDKVDKAAKRAAGSQEKFGRAASRAGSSAKGAAGGVKSLGAAFAVATAKITAIIGTVKAFTSAMGAAFERDAAEQRLKNITSSTGEYNAAIAAASQLSAKFGQTQTETTKALGDTYSRLSGLGYGLKEVTEIYDGFNTIALQSGVAAEDAAGAFFQLSQALGSGTLQGDELRSILERMPQLTQMLATQMNVTAGAIRQMGAEGKITGDVIYQALSKAAAEGGNLEGKLNNQQLAFMALNRAVNEFFVVIGRVFSPAVIAIADKFAQYMQHVNTVFQYLGQTYGPMVAAQMEKLNQAMIQAFGSDYMEKFMTFLQNVGVKVFGLLAKAVAKVVNITAGLVEKFAEIADSPLFRLLADAWGAVADKLGLSNDRIGEFKGKQDEAAESAAGLVNQYSQLPPKIESAKDKKEQMKDAQKELTELVKKQAEAESRSISVIDGKLSLAQAVLDKEQAIHQSKLQQAETDLAAAKTYEQKVDAINRIYEEQVTLAKIQYESTMAAVEAEVAKKQAAVGTQLVLQAQVQTAVELQRSAGIYNAHQEIAIANAMKGVRIAQEQLDVQIQIAQQTKEGAKARFEMAVGAAETLKQQQLQEAQQQRTNAAIAQGVGQMNQLASAASNAASAVAAATGGGGGGGGGGTTRTSRSSQNANGVSYGYHNGMVAVPHEMTNGRSGSDLRIKTPFGEVTWEEFMYYVENPTHGKKHYQASQEAEREEQKRIQYEIHNGPDTYQQSNASRGSSSSSALAPNVNVNYTGSTVNFGGDDYVKKSDVNGIVRSATNATMSTLRRSSGSRLAAGL